MKAKHLFVLALLIAAIATQTINLADVLKNSKAANPTPTPPPTKDIPDDQDFDPSDDPNFVPCGKNQSCGEAKSFSTSQEFEEFVKKYNTENNAQYNIKTFNNFNTFNTISLGPTAMMDASIAAKPSAPLPTVDPNRDFSGTNNQVSGVDEADLLKTDGTYIYTISNKILSIILAYPASKAKVVSKINMKDLNPSAIFIEGDYLAVFGTEYNYYSYPCPYYYPYPIIGGPGPFLDVALAAEPASAARLLQEGTAAKIAI